VIVLGVSHAPNLDMHRAMAHELYGHAYLYFTGREYTHGKPTVEDFIKAVEARVRK